MSNVLTYKGYLGSKEYSDVDQVFYGQVEAIRSLISYEGENEEVLEQSFREAVDDYLEMCEAKGFKAEMSSRNPEKLLIELSEEVHEQLISLAEVKGVELTFFVNEALSEYVMAYRKGSTIEQVIKEKENYVL